MLPYIVNIQILVNIVNRIPCKKIMFTFPIMKTFLTWANVELNTVYILP